MAMKNTKKKPQPQVTEKAPQNKIRTIITSDGKQYKILDSLLMKYSLTCKVIMEDEKNDDQIKLHGVDSINFQYCYEFINHHKEKEPTKIHMPIKSNQDLKYVMEEPDAQLIEKLLLKEDLFKSVLDAANYLQMVEFEKRLMAGLAISLTKYTIDELKEKYDLSKDEGAEFVQEDIRTQIRQKLQQIAESKEQF